MWLIDQMYSQKAKKKSTKELGSQKPDNTHKQVQLLEAKEVPK